MRSMLLKEAKRCTKGWRKAQAKEYKRKLIALNRKNGWDGRFETIGYPEMIHVSEDRELLDEWNAQFRPAFPGRLKIAVKENVHANVLR